MSNTQHVGVGCAAIIIRDGKFLMIKRAGTHGPGTWSVPGGWQEIGETFEQATRREVSGRRLPPQRPALSRRELRHQHAGRVGRARAGRTETGDAGAGRARLAAA